MFRNVHLQQVINSLRNVPFTQSGMCLHATPISWVIKPFIWLSQTNNQLLSSCQSLCLTVSFGPCIGQVMNDLTGNVLAGNYSAWDTITQNAPMWWLLTGSLLSWLFWMWKRCNHHEHDRFAVKSQSPASFIILFCELFIIQMYFISVYISWRKKNPNCKPSFRLIDLNTT